MRDYTYIESIEPQGDGISNVILRGNKKAIIEITKLADKFRADIYHIYNGDPQDGSRENGKSLLKKIEHNDSNQVLTDALGWIDENPGDIPCDPGIRLSEFEK